MLIEVTSAELQAAGKAIALWLEQLPVGYRLQSPLDDNVTMIENPQRTARLIRLLLPVEGHA